MCSQPALRTLICLKPAFSRRCFAVCTAWKGVGEALRNSIKSYALLSDALPTDILPNCLRVVEFAWRC